MRLDRLIEVVNGTLIPHDIDAVNEPQIDAIVHPSNGAINGGGMARSFAAPKTMNETITAFKNSHFHAQNCRYQSHGLPPRSTQTDQTR